MIDRFSILVEKFQKGVDDPTPETIDAIYEYWLQAFEPSEFNKLFIYVISVVLKFDYDFNLRELLNRKLYAEVILKASQGQISTTLLNDKNFEAIRKLLKNYDPKELLKLRLEITE